jgi:putative intracellular protease/amidase
VLKKVIETFYTADKVVAAVCHGPVALAECVKADGTPLVKGLKVTGFTDAEESAVGHTDNVPFLLQKRFVELGADFQAGADWTSNVVVDGFLVTGQNPQSSEATADAAIKILTK